MSDVKEFTDFFTRYVNGSDVKRWQTEIHEMHTRKLIDIAIAFRDSGVEFNKNMNIAAAYDDIIRTDRGIIIFVEPFAVVITNKGFISIEEPNVDRLEYFRNFTDDDDDIIRSSTYRQVEWNETFITNEVGEILLRKQTNVIIDMVKSKLLPEAIALIVKILQKEIQNRGGE